MMGSGGETRRILHAGCGGNPLPEWMLGKEIRLDICPDEKPDILSSMTDIGPVEVDMVYCAHALEHLDWDDVNKALKEFLRVLSPGGFALIVVPDLQDITPSTEIVYESVGGPISGFDMFYGYRKMFAENPAMKHQSGFISETLKDVMTEAGFRDVTTKRLPCFNLMGVGIK